jgi:hypothetical protein
MSDNDSKFKNSKRRHSDDSAIAKQVKIARSNNSNNGKYTTQPHRLAKHRAMDCGNPLCGICGNPRKTRKELSFQERRLFQDLDSGSTD